MNKVACKNCHFYDLERQVCNNPNRRDSKQQYYYGRIKPDSYCALFEIKFATGGLYTGPKDVISGGNNGK